MTKPEVEPKPEQGATEIDPHSTEDKQNLSQDNPPQTETASGAQQTPSKTPQDQPPPEQEEKKKKRGLLWLLLLLLLLIVFLLGALLFRTFFPTQPEEGTLERELAAELGLLPGMTEEEIQDRLNRKVAASMINLSINPTPIFPDGQSAGNLRIENIPGNNYAFTVTITRTSNGETILQTGLIDPGYYVEEMKLDTVLPAGKYLCVATFTAYDTETLAEVGTAGTEMLITVEK